ncbi:MAG: hypothetical protein QOF43_1491 [Gaiellaceae bacterium]|nr:hypothetical protein [Gaiellaceae bacterium]
MEILRFDVIGTALNRRVLKTVIHVLEMRRAGTPLHAGRSPDDRLAAAADPDLRRLLLYARAQPAPLSADDAAAALDVHRNVARARLDRLVDAGFLTVSFARRTGRTGPGAGRPAKIYAVAPETEALEFPDRSFTELAGLLADRLDERALWEIGADYGRALAGRAGLRPLKDVRRGLDRLCAALGSLGFQTSVVDVDGGHVTLASPTCPLRPLVTARPAAVAVDHGMWAGLVESAVKGVKAERIECETRNCFDEHASCQIAFELHDPLGTRAPDRHACVRR